MAIGARHEPWQTAGVGVVELDGSHGEGGGQILRTAVALACITGRELDVVRIRAGRERPGLAAQHVAAVRAAAELCAARVRGAGLGSKRLRFSPTRAVEAGSWLFDVAAERRGGSAGSACLVLQTVALPLALADGASEVTVRGGTHTAWSPPFEYLSEVWAPTLGELGLRVQPSLVLAGFFPEGGGEIQARIEGGNRPAAFERTAAEGEIRIDGTALTARLPDHVGRRLVETAGSLLRDSGLDPDLDVVRVSARSTGAHLFLALHHGASRAGFGALGSRGKLAERVAEEAVAQLLEHRATGAPVDRFLGDQLLLPLALASGPSTFRVALISRHLTTNAWVLERFGIARIAIEEEPAGSGLVRVEPQSSR